MSDEQAVVEKKELSLEVVKSQFNLELQKAGFLKLQKQLEGFEVTEENIVEAQQLMANFRGLKKVIDATHKKEKEPHLKKCQLIDKAKTDMYALVETLVSPINSKYIKVCKDVENRKALQLQEANRVKNIKEGIEKNILHFSTQIAACKTVNELTLVERNINFQKGQPQNKAKFSEFLPEYLEKLTGLSSLIKDQKANIKELEELKEKQKKAAKGDDDAEKLDIAERLEDVSTRIEGNQIKVQEIAIEEATSVDVVTATEIIPDVKARRSTWKWRVDDIKTLQKKMPHLVKLVPDDAAIDTLLETKKAGGELKGKEIESFHGVTFYLEKLY